MNSDKWSKANVSYNYCRICGYTPQTTQDQPNRAPILFWEPDDGWIAGTLCHSCYVEFGNAIPHPDDYAFGSDGICEDTDEDIGELI